VFHLFREKTPAGKPADMVKCIQGMIVVVKGKQITTIFLVALIPLLVAGCSSSGSDGAAPGSQPVAGNQPVAQQQTAGMTTLPPLSYYFARAGQRPDLALISVINSAGNSLDIAIYSLTKPNIVNAILAAKQRGVAVRIITDSEESHTKAQANELNALNRAGIPIKVNSHPGLMHLKVTIADENTVTTGSYNYTNEATYDNDEVLVIIRSKGLAQDWDREFEQMWNDTTDYGNY
jgi:phosphatidylserine/phosphatidylglycerophosphate/cardiolipin synthase-like enzyme